MPKGSNPATKRLVRAGVLCYRCEQSVPTTRDECGPLCKPCYGEMQQLIKSIHLRDGNYRQREDC